MPDEIKKPDSLEVVRSGNIAKFYSNAVQIDMTIWDFNLLFGELKSARQSPPVIDVIAEVRMSPQHAKALAGVLAENVANYEKLIGEIKLLPHPPEDENKDQ